MSRWLFLALLVLLPLTLTRAEEEKLTTPPRIAAHLAAACSDGIQRAIQQETGDAVSREALQLLQLSEGLQRALPQLLPPPEACPAGWTRHQDSCFLIPPRATTWYLAHHVCAALDRRARLASVHPGSAGFVQRMVAAFNASRAVWVGLARLDLSSEWLWSDGSPLDHVSWDRGEPSGGQERCVHMGWPNRSNYLWHDNACHVVLNLLCQINLK